MNHKLVKEIAGVAGAILVLTLAALLLVAAPGPLHGPAQAMAPQPHMLAQSALSPAYQGATGCVEGNKVDDLHVGLPGWTIHARPAGQASPVLTAVTNGTGYFRFDNLATGTWTFWEEMQAGWAPVTLPMFDAEVTPGPDCIYIRFKNKQGTATPTATPTNTPTAVPAVRIRGFVYVETCEGLAPLPGVTLEVWKSDDPNTPETKVQTRGSDPSGFWNFYLPVVPPPYYHVLLYPPAGLVPESASAPLGFVLALDHLRFDSPIYRVYGDNVFVLRDPELDCGATPTPTPSATPGGLGCVEGHKIDDYHIGLPLWEIHARPAGLGQPEYTAFSDGSGYFRFDDLTPGNWTFWEIVQDGWEPVTAPMFDALVRTGEQCTYIRFKNRQVQPTSTPTQSTTPTLTPTSTNTPTPGPSPTPTPTLPPGVTPTATPTVAATATPTVTPTLPALVYRLYLPLIWHEHGRDFCEESRLTVVVHGTHYSFSLRPDGNIKSVRPLPWNSATLFQIVGYEGPVRWTLYSPFYDKQIGGYEYTFPGGYAGERFSLFIDTYCGIINVHTEVDDPTPTPVPRR